MTVVAPTLADLTAGPATLTGSGVFDVLMRANKAHLDDQFEKGRIKGPEYATVYLGSLEQVLSHAVQFLLTKDKTALDAQLIEKQIALADKQLLQADVELQIAQVKLEIAQQEKLKTEAEIAHLTAQTALVTQQKTNLVAEALNIPKQGALLDAQKLKVDGETLNLASQKLQIEAQTALLTQQQLNAVTENTVLVAQECKLRAEFDVLMETKLKTGQETQLLSWKVTTEKAQTSSLGVDVDSVIGKQKALYGKQAEGFTRDAEQKVAKVLVDTWSVRRTTDEATVADATNMLNDVAVGRAINKLLSGVGA